jgi:hypothetical protein
MQTHVYLRPPKKTLEPHPEAEARLAANVLRKVTGITIHAAAPHIRHADNASRNPGRILDNADAGFVDKKGPVFIEL